jgi:hypothetical protein
VQVALRYVPGVACAHADFEAETATAWCVEEVAPEDLIQALELRGWGGSIVPGPAPPAE